MSLVKIDKEIETPIYLQIYNEIRDKILAGLISEGYALPSERRLAEELGVHRNTVTKAYNELKSEDMISSHQGKGYKVHFRQRQINPKRKKDVNWESMINHDYRSIRSDFDILYSKGFDRELISFAGGVADRSVYPPEEMAETLRRILSRNMDKAYFYTSFQGDLELREEICKFLVYKGIRTSKSNIQVFAENNQALDFIFSSMLERGDRIIIDETMSADLHRTIQLAGAEIVPMPHDDMGIICDGLDEVVMKYKPKFIYVDSSFNNPRGTFLSLERKKKILDISYKYRIPIIEEDEGSELYFEEEPLPSIKSMDWGDNVIYLYSFSLTMMPGVGNSFVVANDKIIESMSEMVSLKVANSDWASQMLMLEYLRDGKYFNRLDDYRRIYKEKRDLMCRHLDRLVLRYGLSYRKPEGGVYLWVKLPSRINARKLLKETQKLGMTFMPGYLFYPKASMGKNFFRLNYSYPTFEGIDRGMGILEEALANILR